MRKLLAVLAVAGAALTVAPEAVVHASPSACRKYNGGDWGYTFCAEGTGVYFTRLRCVHWIGNTPVIYYAYGDWARAKIDASVGWCPDGYKVRRIRWFTVPA